LQTARVLEIITPVKDIPQTAGFLLREDHPPRNDVSHKEHDAYFDFFPVPENIAGYVWDFPTQVQGQPMRCWGIYDTNILADQKRPVLRDPLAKEMARHGYDLDDYEIKGHPIRWYEPQNQISVPHVILVGDAAGVDPFFGEGISMALGYGTIAAQEISESIQRNEFSFHGYKRRVSRSGLGQTLFARWVITYIIYPIKWKWFQVLVWQILQSVVLLVAWIFVLTWSKRLK
jgi:flavin-dependent dehydrogenase